ncbi:hypothetical protein AAKU64_001322 [Undibacterium sp. GrIS 1.8]|uniref:DUF4431 domain-containing protein n=1 Tax=unclassified Undibacterium TaxID=2630295 RepID=UPI003394960D
MRTLLKLFLFITVLLNTPAFAATDCLSYEPVKVKLAGKLHRATFPGAPNFESIKDGDTAETGFYLTLTHAICTVTTPGSEQTAFASVKEIQLVLNQSQYKKLRPKLGTQIQLSGSLFSAISGHHHTDVLLQVDE